MCQTSNYAELVNIVMHEIIEEKKVVLFIDLLSESFF